MAIVWIVIGAVLIAVELHHLAFYAMFAAAALWTAGVLVWGAFLVPSLRRS